MTERPKLTPRQREVLDYLRGHPDSTVREVGEAFGIVVNGAETHIRALIRKGYLIREEGRSRAMRVVGAPTLEDVRPLLTADDPDGLILTLGGRNYRVSLIEEDFHVQ